MKKTLFILFLIACNQVLAQTFNYRYDIQDDQVGDAATNIETTSDGYIVFRQGKFPTFPYKERIGFFGIDESGNQIFDKVYGADSIFNWTGWSNNGSPTMDGNYVICGWAQFDTIYNPYIIKYTEMGDTLWRYNYYSNYEYRGFSGCQASDGGYVVVGLTDEPENPNDPPYLGYILKTDSEGEFLWLHKYWSLTYSIYILSVAPLEDGFIASGVAIIDGFNSDLIVIRTDSMGNEIWRKLYGSNSHDGDCKVNICGDGNFIIAGYWDDTTNDAPFVAFPFVAKIDSSDGDVIWERKFYPGSYSPDLLKILELNDGSIVTAGWKWSSATVNGEELWSYKGVIAKLSSEGDSLWMRTYAFEDGYESTFRDVIASNDGGFIAVGQATPSPDYISSDAWVVKTDEFGCVVPGCQVSILEEEQTMNFLIYPNPTNDVLNIYLETIGSSDGIFIFTDLSGREIKSFKASGNLTTYGCDLSFLSAGTYILSYTGSIGTLSKVILKR